jgi:hypothetical protein
MRKTTKNRLFQLAVKEDNTAVQQAERVLAQAPGKTNDMLSFMYYLYVREQQAGILRPFYAEERTNHATSHFLYRKLRPSAYINRMKTDQKLARSLRDHFQDPVLVLGACLLPIPVTMNQHEEKICRKCCNSMDFWSI